MPSPRTKLTAAALMAGRYPDAVALSAYAPPADARKPTREFEGTLAVSGPVQARLVHADKGLLTRKQITAAQSFPQDFRYAFVQEGDVLLPVRRGYIVTRHPYWDIVLEPGRVWNEPGDHGDTRAALPFALVQKNNNCTHYGVLTFLFGDGGSISHVALQISSETCKYLKLDMWGALNAQYRPHRVAAKAEVIAAYRANQSHRLPERPIAQLAVDYPGIDPSGLALGEAKSYTLYGLVAGGIHYVSDCPTRHGDYPFCDRLPFPSYSLAKSVEASVAALAMEQRHPGTLAAPVQKLAPLSRCRSASWRGVRLRHLLDMTSGHYDSAGYLADEDDPKIGRFFAATTERQKAAFACGAYPRRAPPGQQWVYHTSDIFLLGDELNRYLRRRTGHPDADVFRDVVVARVYAPLDLSATARATRRTADKTAQPFFGYGLQFNRDDIARLALFLGPGGGRIGGSQMLDAQLLARAMQRIAGEHGAVVTGYPQLRYQLGFWARNVAPAIGCEKPAWVPFMSGFGGISVVLYPNGVIYYNVTDSDTPAVFDWSPSAVVARAIADFCR